MTTHSSYRVWIALLSVGDTAFAPPTTDTCLCATSSVLFAIHPATYRSWGRCCTLIEFESAASRLKTYLNRTCSHSCTWNNSGCLAYMAYILSHCVRKYRAFTGDPQISGEFAYRFCILLRTCGIPARCLLFLLPYI